MRKPLRLFTLFFTASLALTPMALATEQQPSAIDPTPSSQNASAFKMISLNTSDQRVLMIQQRLTDLNYFAYKTTGSYGSMTRDSIIRFQELNGLMADGVIGEETYLLLFNNSAVRASIAGNVHIPIGPSSSTPPEVFGEQGDWNETIDARLTLGMNYTVTDLNTDETFTIQRTGGVNHARVETATASDTQVFLSIFGGEFNWSKRPVVVEIGNIKYAASLQGMPQGDSSVSGNNMDGSCSLYFYGSRSDISNLPDEEHRRVVLRATGTNW